MSIEITEHDIGAEIISILTKGMYPDPLDALREYVQNSVDANAKKIDIKVHGNSIIVEDDGYGMDDKIMRKAIRVGISDKNPKNDVGFRGIGIYSSFHLCDKLSIYSKSSNTTNPFLLIFDFKSMKDLLEKQQINRLKGISSKLINLQSILQNNIELENINIEEFPKIGTRIEIDGLNSNFFQSISRFEEVAEYLRQVIPVHFDLNKFRWAKIIENTITEICKKHKAEFKLVNLNLQVNNRTEELFRPYTDEQFENMPLEPYFKEIKNKEYFFGVTWGCLNSARKKISDKDLRGFLVRKQGFAIGKRSDISKYFGRTTYFDRYIGEIIVVHPNLLPNAPRTDFEASLLKTMFYETLNEVAFYFNKKADNYQEYTKGDEELDESIIKLREIEGSFLFFSENTEELINKIIEVRNIYEQIQGRLKRDVIRKGRRKEAITIIKLAKSLEKDIQGLINKSKTNRKEITDKMPEVKSIERLRKLPEIRVKMKLKEPKCLNDIFSNLDILITEQMKKILNLIDEKFLQDSTNNKNEYQLALRDVQKQIEEENDERL